MEHVIGSSPRVWGQEIRQPFRRNLLRIIPTRVGTSCFSWAIPTCNEDHPHACGDKKEGLQPADTLLGSSPRVWGQVEQRYLYCSPHRIIPTRVGTRISCKFTVCVLKDHPHACGDKISDLLMLTGTIGSSPRVWGQASSGEIFLPLIIIIPTRVGTSR